LGEFRLYTAHLQAKTVQEVVAMTPALQYYAEQDEGFQQFCTQYKLASADPKTRNDYWNWIDSVLRDEGIKEAAMMEGEERSDIKWQGVIAEKDAALATAIAEKDALLEKLKVKNEGRK